MFRIRHILTYLSFLIPCLAIAMPETQATNWTSKASGEIGESIMDTFYKAEGWEKLPVREANSLNGLDGVFVKRNANGTIVDFMAVESKTNSSQLSKVKSEATQGSTQYISEKLDAAEEYMLENNPADKEALNDIKQLKKLTKAGAVKSRLVHTEIVGNRINVTITPLTDGASPSLITKGTPKKVLEFDLSLPKNNFERKIQREILNKLKTYLLNKGVSEQIIEEIIKDILKGGNIIKIISDRLAGVEVKGFFSSNTKIGKLIPPAELEAKKVNITEGKITKITKNGKTLSVLKVKFPASLKMGAGGGVGTFVIGEGVALYKYSTGSIDDIELKEETIKWAGESIVVAVAIAACGSNPAGWVVLGVGIGAAAIYEICYDFSFPPKLTEDDLLGLLPDDLKENLYPIGKRDNLIYSDTSESFFDIEGKPSALETKGTGKLETGRESVLILQ